MFTKWPPSVSIPIFYVLTTVAVVYKLLLGNIYGIFILSLVLYHYGAPLFGTTPFGFNDLVCWIAAQSESIRAALLGAIVTVVGFLIAYSTATANWKSQLLANLKLQAAGELEVFFAECSKLASDCKIYADALIEAVDKIQKGCSVEDAEFLAHYNRDKGQIYLQRKDRLVSLGIEVHRLHGKYSTLLISAPGLKNGLDSATAALEKITNKLWIQVPFHIQNDRNPIQTFVNQVNITECSALKNAIEENFGELNFASGGVRGTLMSTVVTPNIWSLIYLYKERSGFKAAITQRYKHFQKNS